MLKIFTYSLPAIAWGNEFIPILPLIGHKFTLQIGYESICETQIEISSNYSLNIARSDNSMVLAPNNAEDPVEAVRNAVKIEDVRLVYKRPPAYLEVSTQQLYAWKVVEIPLLEDLYTLKIVSYKAFVEIYKLLTGNSITTKQLTQDIVDFTIARRFITPKMLTYWNANANLRYYLPYKMVISGINNGNVNNDE